jgi:hypothetical protein
MFLQSTSRLKANLLEANVCCRIVSSKALPTPFFGYCSSTAKCPMHHSYFLGLVYNLAMFDWLELQLMYGQYRKKVD